MNNSKSQIGQDKWLDENVFKYKTDGVFIEVGAFDGIAGSNTYFFEKERNWSGLLIEPHVLNFKEMVNNSNRERSIMENFAIDTKEGQVDFYMMDGACDILSGIIDHYDHRHRNRIDYELDSFKKNPFSHRHETQQNIVKVNSCRLQSLINKHRLNNIDLVSIDVEGAEMSVLESINFDNTNIYCFLIENNFGEQNVEQYLLTKGYQILTKLSYDDVYIKMN